MKTELLRIAFREPIELGREAIPERTVKLDTLVDGGEIRLSIDDNYVYVTALKSGYRNDIPIENVKTILRKVNDDKPSTRSSKKRTEA